MKMIKPIIAITAIALAVVCLTRCTPKQNSEALQRKSYFVPKDTILAAFKLQYDNSQIDSSNYVIYNRLRYYNDGSTFIVDTTLFGSGFFLNTNTVSRLFDTATARHIRRMYWKKHLNILNTIIK